jgi:alkylation response protein AidB-like acyl-CoA dehydrogenase
MEIDVTKTAPWTEEELAAFEAGLTPQNLSAVMRATWTWDDRALRRDLARVLTALAAVRELSPGELQRLARGRALQSAAALLAAVLGPRVTADTGRVATYSFSEALIRSPRLADALEDAAFITALGAETLETSVDASAAAAPSLELLLPLAAHALSATGDTGLGAEYLAKIEAGVLAATLAAAEESGAWDPALVRTRASLRGSHWVLDGEKLFVPDAETADVLLVIGRSVAGPSLFAVERAAAGVTVTPMAVMDPTRPLSRLHLADVPATLIGLEGAGGSLLGRVLDLATVSLAEEQVRGARQCLELAVAAAQASPPSTRTTDVYGDLRMRLEVALATLARALRVGTTDTEDARVAAAMAHISCAEAFTHIARVTVQLVGDSDAAEEAGALFRRAQSSELLFGGPAVSHERLLERLGI